MLRSCSTARLLLLSRRCCLLSSPSAIRARSGHLVLSPRPTAGRASSSSSPPLSPSSSSSTTRTTKTTTPTMALGADPAASSAAPASAATPAPPASSAAAVRGLDPPLLWQHFLTLSALPRPSKREGAVVRWLRAFAEERKEGPTGLELREDAAGNVLIFRPGSGGGEDAEVVCVQGVRRKRRGRTLSLSLGFGRGGEKNTREVFSLSQLVVLLNILDSKILKKKIKSNQNTTTAHRHGYGEGRRGRARL